MSYIGTWIYKLVPCSLILCALDEIEFLHTCCFTGNIECRIRKLFCEDIKHFIHSNSDYLAGLVLHLIQRREVCFKTNYVTAEQA